MTLAKMIRVAAVLLSCCPFVTFARQHPWKPMTRDLLLIHSKHDLPTSRSIATLSSSSSSSSDFSRGGSTEPAVPQGGGGGTSEEEHEQLQSAKEEAAESVPLVTSGTESIAPESSISISDNNSVTEASVISEQPKEPAADAAAAAASDSVSTGEALTAPIQETTSDTTVVEEEPAAAIVKQQNAVARFFAKHFHKKPKNKNYKAYAKKLKNRNNLNIRRKLMHCSFGLFFAFTNHFVPRKIFLPAMITLSSGTLLMELLRYKPAFQWMNDILHGVLGSSLRKHEMEGKFTGSFYFFTGVTVTAAAFDRNAATLGIAQLALADPSASYFGRATRHVYWSRIENGLGGIGRNKGVLGFLGGALFCFPFNYRVLSIAKYVTSGGSDGGTVATLLPGGKQAVVLASLALGFAGALADLCVPTPAVVLPKKIWGVRVPPLHLDDNFVVPIVSAWACEKVFAALSWKAECVKLGTFLLLNGPGKGPVSATNLPAVIPTAAASP